MSVHFTCGINIPLYALYVFLLSCYFYVFNSVAPKACFLLGMYLHISACFCCILLSVFMLFASLLVDTNSLVCSLQCAVQCYYQHCGIYMWLFFYCGGAQWCCELRQFVTSPKEVVSIPRVFVGNFH